MTLPRITKDVRKAIDDALAYAEAGDRDRALAYADLLKRAGFGNAAARVRKMVGEKRPEGDQQ